MIKRLNYLFFTYIVFALSSCTTGYIQVEKIKTDKRTFASRFARSPDDKALLNPPKGEKLYINWSLPIDFNPGMYRLRVGIIYRNLTKETLLFPIKRRAGARIIELLGDEYKEKEGFLSYKLEIVSVDGKLIDDYTHRMWVDLILPCGVGN